MLSKEVCKKCVEQEFEWDGIDDDEWDNGRVACPSTHTGIIGYDGGASVGRRIVAHHDTLTNKAPPPHCQHKLEHALAAGMVSGIEGDLCHCPLCHRVYYYRGPDKDDEYLSNEKAVAESLRNSPLTLGCGACLGQQDMPHRRGAKNAKS